MTRKLLMANEAFAHAALEAGVRVVAGYPGTPSSELIETVAKLHAAGVAHGVHVEWSANEKAALELLAGASYCGARVLFTCKQVGLNVASDALMSLNYIGVRGGCVLFVADDPGPISSQTEQDTRRFAAFAKVPVFDPSTPEQGFLMMKAAFDLSERYHTPVIVRPTTRICHASTFFEVADETYAREVPDEGFERSPRWVIFPRRAWEAHGEVNDRLCEIAQSEDLCEFNPITHSGSIVSDVREVPAAESCESKLCETGCKSHKSESRECEPHGHKTHQRETYGIVAGGVTAAYAKEALVMLGDAVAPCRFWQVGTPYPFPEKTAAKFVEGLTDILVLEELDHTLEDALLAYAGKIHAAFTVHGKLTGEARDRGENDVDDIRARIAQFLRTGNAGRSGGALVEPVPHETFPTPENLPTRPPVLCAGCPHRGSFYAVKRALGKTPAVLCGDIGCYTLGNAKPLDAVDTCLCMGAGITMAQGFAVAEPGKKQIAFVGDSTFFASAMTGIANAVYNEHDITVCVLDNATTAMTGSQPHPGTGVTLMGARHAPISIEAVLRALGLECVVHADPLCLEQSISAVQEAISFNGPSAVLFESPCVQLKKPSAPVFIDPTRCTGCKKCITEIGCPGIAFDPNARGAKSAERGQAVIDATLCNGCGLCVQVCPFGAIASAEETPSAPPATPTATVPPTAPATTTPTTPTTPTAPATSEGGHHA